MKSLRARIAVSVCFLMSTQIYIWYTVGVQQTLNIANELPLITTYIDSLAKYVININSVHRNRLSSLLKHGHAGFLHLCSGTVSLSSSCGSHLCMEDFMVFQSWRSCPHLLRDWETVFWIKYQQALPVHEIAVSTALDDRSCQPGLLWRHLGSWLFLLTEAFVSGPKCTSSTVADLW